MPISLPVLEGSLKVPCGHCWQCYERSVRDWAFRAMQEEKRSRNTVFLTLTYNNDFCPEVVDQNTGEYLKTLRSSDWTAFIRKLKGLGNFSDMRFLAHGEYSPESYKLKNGIWTSGERPHHHAVLFNSPDVQIIEDAWSSFSDSRGYVSVKPCRKVRDSVYYMCKYIHKNFDVWSKSDCREKPKLRVSKGFGSNYLTPQMIAWHLSAVENCFCVVPGGIRVAMPRYYRKKIYCKDERFARLVSEYKQNRFLDIENRNFAKFKERNSFFDEDEIFRRYNLARNMKHITRYDLLHG